MDLSRVFDTLDHSLLSAKLSAYGFDNNSLSFVKSYLTNKFQRCKIENHFSNWRKVTFGVPQSSTFGVPQSSDLFSLISLSITITSPYPSKFKGLLLCR